MKFFLSIFIICIILGTIYFLTNRIFGFTKKQKATRFKKFPLLITGIGAYVLFGLLFFVMYNTDHALDTQCTKTHQTTNIPPKKLTTAMEYFMQGNYDYDTGNCVKAIADYSKSITLNPLYPQVYNNRAYTFMRLRDFAHALSDLNKAISLNPHYIQALMNRGDIYNYYFKIDRQKAISDYENVIRLGGKQETSVCGHLFLATHNGWNIGTFLDLPKEFKNACSH
jgi:tetratricopeptide (TPR) repeat protein